MNRKQVLVFKALPADQLARLRHECDVVVGDPRVPQQKAAFQQALSTVDGMIGASHRFDDALLDAAPNLKVISSVSVGVDNYPLASLKSRGIMLCHTPGVLTETVADLYFSMILATSRRIVELANLVREGRWTGSIQPDMFGWDVHGKTLGILGYGRIGQAIARRAARGFDMQVLYHTRTQPSAGDADNRIMPASFKEVLSESDFVVVVLPLTGQTLGLIGSAEFAMMKPGAIFINGARGAIVQETALLDALNRGTLRAAGLDVFMTEPLPADSPLRTHPKVVPLPHAGSATHETRHAMAEMATTNLLLALKGRPPLAVFDA
ncbi:MAG TPA: D-glycerate dehydrogenase [Burkholderiaceae bacterium]|nr:D-glycerate dehydrogenase [Burkholderiaceae bacterium]